MSAFSDRPKKQKQPAPADAAVLPTVEQVSPAETVTEQATPAADNVQASVVSEEQFLAEQAAAAAPPPPPFCPPPQPEPPVKSPRAVKVMVRETGRVMIGSSRCKIVAGTVLDSNLYDDNTWRAILAHLHTDPVEDEEK